MAVTGGAALAAPFKFLVALTGIQSRNNSSTR